MTNTTIEISTVYFEYYDLESTCNRGRESVVVGVGTDKVVRCRR